MSRQAFINNSGVLTDFFLWKQVRAETFAV